MFKYTLTLEIDIEAFECKVQGNMFTDIAMVRAAASAHRRRYYLFSQAKNLLANLKSPPDFLTVTPGIIDRFLKLGEQVIGIQIALGMDAAEINDQFDPHETEWQMIMAEWFKARSYGPLATAALAKVYFIDSPNPPQSKSDREIALNGVLAACPDAAIWDKVKDRLVYKEDRYLWQNGIDPGT
jgi:hypothetical protein